MLPAVGLPVHLLPLEADHVDEEPLGEPVPAHDRGRERTSGVGEAKRAVVEQLGVALLDQPADLLRHRGRRQAQPFHEPCPDRGDALLLDLEDRLQVLLGCIVHFGHG